MRPAPEISVLLGRVSAAQGGIAVEILEALRRQEAGPAYEVVVADRLDDRWTGEMEAGFPETVVLRAPAGTPLPALRTLALGRARGERVAVLGDTCVPAPGWLAALAAALDTSPPEVVAAGGCVLDGTAGGRAARAALLCEYLPFLPPVAGGETASLPGMNVLYRRAAFAGVDEDLLASGFWELTLHPRLRAGGHRFRSVPAARVIQKRALPLGRFLRQRYLASRALAGNRFHAAPPVWRAAGVLASPLLPALLLARQAREVAGKRGWQGAWLASLPHLALFFTAGAAGEAVGALAGPGNALAGVE